MPYISESIKLNEKQDRRRKLTQEQKEIIKREYATGGYSLMDLAKIYGVSKKTILLTVNPQSKKNADSYIKANWHKYKGTNEERAKARRETRAYKQGLYLKGELVATN